MKHKIFRLLVLAIFTVVGIGVVKAAPPICTPYTPSATYPTNGNFFICFSKPDSIRLDQVVRAVRELPSRQKGGVTDLWRDVLQKHQQSNSNPTRRAVKYYYFKNRAQGQAYFRATAPYNVNAWVPFDGNGRCGQTGYAPAGSDRAIAVAIYDRCTTFPTGVEFNNTMLYRVTVHESAHAYNYAISSARSSTMPSKTSGYKRLLDGDKAVLTPSDWNNAANWTQTRKNISICQAFGSVLPSVLELDLLATSNPVCSAVTGLPIDGNDRKTPTQIAVEKLPYFVNDVDESWAEQMVIRRLGANGVPLLQLTDRILGYGTATGAGIKNLRYFNCTRVVANSYFVKNAPPTAAEFLASGCPANAGQL